MHPARLLQLFDAGDVELAPVAACAARRETSCHRVVINAVRLTIDPAKTQRLDHGFVVAHTRLIGALLPEADPLRSRFVVIGLEPLAKLSGRLEEPDVLRLHQPPASRSMRWRTRALTTLR